MPRRRQRRQKLGSRPSGANAEAERANAEARVEPSEQKQKLELRPQKLGSRPSEPSSRRNERVLRLRSEHWNWPQPGGHDDCLTCASRLYDTPCYRYLCFTCSSLIILRRWTWSTVALRTCGSRLNITLKN
ncbi:hypothetical protein BS47DRAFT_1488610 [Hydnum rufescens UP504]|uniref:Uncharacterized protein n=1 Tax=Hydnum rufescens UP504 TaxID=1448309 RepID=A0A9P6ALA7_9AGAM|nr:hypothetical protein BS47DRAFT_1488610 [Hydnum rufescens UP504]